MDFLFSIAHVCRHIQVAAMMRKDQPHVKHQFDPWHVAKSVRKDLVAASKKRECANLGPWISSIVNHLWWSASTCNSDPRLCQEKWKSILYHVAGIHEWPGFELFSKCDHEELTEEQRRNKEWSRIGFPASNALKEVAWKPKLLKDVLLLAEFVQTGGLEVFHGTMAKKYLPKSQHYSYNGMKCHTQLAVIDNNWNAGREIATTKNGEARYKCVYPKLQKKWVAKPIYEEKSYQFVKELMMDTILMKQGEIQVAPVQVPAIPANIAPVARGSKQDIISQHMSRFQ